MFKKILLAEDFDTINIAVIDTLKNLSVADYNHAKYCDEALLKIRKAIHDGDPFDLLITDLSFIPDGRPTALNSGEDLIAAVRKIQPEIKIIVFSIEDKPFRIRTLFQKYLIAGYVFKGRNSIGELKKAISMAYANGIYISPALSHVRADNSVNEIDDYDIELLKLLSQGLTQSEISLDLKNRGVSPSSTSALEKRINRLKIYFRANNNVQIVVIAKDLGFI